MYSERFFCLLIKKHPFLDIYSSLEEHVAAEKTEREPRKRVQTRNAMPRPPTSSSSSYFSSIPPQKKKISLKLLHSAAFFAMTFFVLNQFEKSKPLDLMSIAEREATSLPEEIVDAEGISHKLTSSGSEEDGGEFNLKDSIVPLNSDLTYCFGAPGAWFARADTSTKRMMKMREVTTQKKGGVKVWETEAYKFCSSPDATATRRRSLLGFSDVQCARTCRSVKRDHVELLSEQNRQAREDLLDCLTSDGGCRKVFSIKERWGNMAKFAYELPSVKMLTEYKPKCFSVSKARVCSNMKGNKETPNGWSTKYFDYLKPRYDVKYKELGTCVMVGNSPHVYRDGLTDENSKSIDKHDNVWRFNLRSGLANDTNVHKKYGIKKPLGKRTQFRMFNSIRGRQLSRGINVDEKILRSKRNLREEWWFWYSTSTSYFHNIKKRFPYVQTRVLSPSSVNYIVDCYMQMRRDLLDIGALGKEGDASNKKLMKCPTSLSSGIHLAFMSQHLCSQMNMFGMSYHPKQAAKAGYSGHAWSIDVRMFRLMHVVGLVNVCTTDKSLD